MYTSLSLAAALIAAPAINAAVVPLRARHFPGYGYTPKAFAPETPLETSAKYAQLARNAAGNGGISSIALRAALASNSTGSAASTPLTNSQGVEYLVPISWGSQSFNAILDTGSSDTWLISSSYTCEDSSGNQVDASTCNFAPGFSGTFSGGQIQNENFDISYGDGEFVTGQMGYQDVTIAGITVPKQEVALGTAAYWNGDGASSGLVGLAYPGITSAFEGTDPSQDQTREQYDPLFTTMYKDGLSSSMFSLALQRGDAGGYIAFGGLPPVTVDANSFVSTDIQQYSLGSGSSGFTFYAMTPSAINYGTSKSNSQQYIVDSGTTLVYLPTSLAKTVNAAFSPKATSQDGTYLVDCTATPPKFGVTIGGTTLYANAADMILQQPDPSTGKCVSGIQDGGSTGPFILGDVWMRSVVVVFDVGASQMKFAPHDY